MRHPAFIMLLLLSAHYTYAQDSLAVDSVKESRVYFTHYYDQAQWSSVNFLRSYNDRKKFTPSNGVPIFNAVRAQVPNLLLPTRVYQAFGTPRSDLANVREEVGYLIDGVPFNANLGLMDIYNLNGFDFSALAVASSPASLAFIDLPGRGAMMLQSRDGRGYMKPSFEFNSYFTTVWNDDPSQNMSEALVTSNSFAYMQDFGEADLRVSYNLSTNGTQYRTPFYHNVKVNTGFDITPRLSARIILDDRYTIDKTSLDLGAPASKWQNFFQSNFTITYQFSEWFSLSGQWVISQRDSIIDLTNDTVGFHEFRDRNDNQILWNVFARFQKQVGNHFSLSGFLGFQQVNLEREVSTTGYFNGSQTSNRNVFLLGSNSGSGMVTVSYDKLLSASFQFRQTVYDTVRSGDPARNTYSVGAAFNYAELLKAEALPMGRIRVSYGEKNATKYGSYPHATMAYPGRPQLGTFWEVGTDLALGSSAFDFTLNYFSSTIKDGISYQYGYFGYTTDLKVIDDGWEVLLNYQPQINGGFFNRSTLSFSTYDVAFLPQTGYASSFHRAGLYNESRWNDILVSFLLEHTAYSGVVNTNAIRFRDLTIGFESGNATDGRFTFLITARNFTEFFAGPDLEKRVPFNKSVSASINLQF